MSPTPPFDSSVLPAGWRVRVPEEDDIDDLVALCQAHELAVRGGSHVDPGTIAGAATGLASWTRRQLVLSAPDGRLVAWACAHDRAAGRTMTKVTIDPDLPEADAIARALFAWTEQAGAVIARGRGLASTQLDASPFADDERQRRWLAEAGYGHVRTWLQMSRPVNAREAEPGVLPEPREGVTVRPVSTHDDGRPVAADLQTVHLVLEQSFADHFNSYRESFPEFVQRQREGAGHRWDHWWLAWVDVDGEQLPGGAVVGTLLLEDSSGAKGIYVEYLGVHDRARGRGVAKALLSAVIHHAAERGRNRVGLEVDDDSPTHADALYRALGWRTQYKTESWHKDVSAGHA